MGLVASERGWFGMADGGVSRGWVDGLSSPLQPYGIALVGRQGAHIDWALGVGRTMWKGAWQTWPAVYLAWHPTESLTVSATFPEGVAAEWSAKKVATTAFARAGGQTWGRGTDALALSWVDLGAAVHLQLSDGPLRLKAEAARQVGRTLGDKSLEPGVWASVSIAVVP